MRSVVMVLEGYCQSWGDTTIGHHRKTAAQPSKSAIVGMISSALGRDKEDDISDLAALKFGVRSDSVGVTRSDYHTVRILTVPSRSEYADRETLRDYIYDGIFVAVVGSTNETLMSEVECALKNPARPIFLGRRSCVPSRPVFEYASDVDFDVLLDTYPAQSHSECALITRDITPMDERERFMVVPDVPLSFSVNKRSYGARATVSYSVALQKDTPVSPVRESAAAIHKDPAFALAQRYAS